jgi:hypothetical protein
MPYADPKDPRKLQRVNAWSAANPKKVKAAKQKYAESNKEACRARVAAWMEQNKEQMKEIRKVWRERNKHKSQAYVRKRQAAKMQRTPKWLSKDDLWMLEEAYEVAVKRTKLFGFQWDVDHIVPLQGNTVSGLHVPWNIQVIPAVVNSSKGARL